MEVFFLNLSFKLIQNIISILQDVLNRHLLSMIEADPANPSTGAVQLSFFFLSKHLES